MTTSPIKTILPSEGSLARSSFRLLCAAMHIADSVGTHKCLTIFPQNNSGASRSEILTFSAPKITFQANYANKNYFCFCFKELVVSNTYSFKLFCRTLLVLLWAASKEVTIKFHASLFILGETRSTPNL